jgi:hypothetical protein
VKHFIRKCSGRGDEVVAEWDTDTISAEKLAEIEAEFNAKVAQGWLAGDLKTSEIGKVFNPNADTLMIPPIQGG